MRLFEAIGGLPVQAMSQDVLGMINPKTQEIK